MSGTAPDIRVAESRLHAYKALAVICWWLLIALFVGGLTSGTTRHAALITVAAAAIWAVRRAYRVELSIVADKLLVRNYWRSFEFDWKDVTDVGVGLLMAGVVPQRVFVFRIADGTQVRAQATATRASLQEELWEQLQRAAPKTVIFHPRRR